MGAEKKIKRRMIDIIYRVSAGLQALASQGSPLKKILSKRLSTAAVFRADDQHDDLLSTFNEAELLIRRGRGPQRHKRATFGPEKGGGCFLQAPFMRSTQGQGRAEKRRAPSRLTLKSLRASVCSASEGSVVRGENSPSLQKLKASLLHKADSGKKDDTHTHLKNPVSND